MAPKPQAFFGQHDAKYTSGKKSKTKPPPNKGNAGAAFGADGKGDLGYPKSVPNKVSKSKR